MFESNYLKYQQILSGNCTDIKEIMNSDFEDRTLLYEIYNFIESNYNDDKINYLKERYPLL